MEAIIPRKRLPTKKGNLKEYVAWRVPKDRDYPEGVKYSFTLIIDGKRAAGIDNYNREGHHVHTDEKKKSYIFTTLKHAKNDFEMLVERIEKCSEQKN